MKTINESFSDEEFEGLLTKKKGQSWHDYILGLTPEPVKQFLSMLAHRQESISCAIETSAYSTALRQIVILLNLLSVPEGEVEVLKLKESLSLQNYHEATTDDVTTAYVILSDFLNRVYFKEFYKNPKTEK